MDKNIINQSFGSVWTNAKLEVIDNYLGFYVTALKKQRFKLCYIDAFAGSGKVKIKAGDEIDGSAIRALKYGFDRFYFFEKDAIYYNLLQQRIERDFWDLSKKVTLKNEDCNDLLMKINEYDWIANRWRGVIFLDPYAMQLSWECLERISKTKVFDVWYLFPFSAVNRNLYKNVDEIPQANKDAVTRILGTDDWKNEIYKESAQLNLFDQINYDKEGTDMIRKYIIKRLNNVFPTVSEKAVLLKNEKNSPVFMLCFAGSNPSQKAKKLSLNAADFILSKL